MKWHTEMSFLSAAPQQSHWRGSGCAEIAKNGFAFQKAARRFADQSYRKKRLSTSPLHSFGKHENKTALYPACPRVCERAFFHRHTGTAFHPRLILLPRQ